ncbi:MAG: 30S ribosomal protein S6 [Anaerolineae bacterium]|jgi:small subunit ribosomal protein S6|nr:30S ribosomal protein S6 [Anaerolineae bacterium]MBT3713159.1 30S ribosomal protein S6 [Anaerolineae bacterium]MBT4310368.1 30S ribosomal protein S6 [Anaerolineae bacterium]MBT4458884.1 30S ribosomal protein S6 [Anaerolineae bacterium]MBT6062169.1 30S ribosomal protein S6 [Anaerolineae bacterium]
MRNYELTCILHPDLDETAFNEALEKIKGWITESDGKVEKVDNWGRRKMAYMIRKQLEGQYFLIHASMLPATITEMERKLRLLEPVMRYMFVLVN